MIKALKRKIKEEGINDQHTGNMVFLRKLSKTDKMDLDFLFINK